MAPAFSTRAEVRISAPAIDVWTKLIDTSTWPQWNSFVSQAKIIGADDGSTDGSTVLKLHDRVRFVSNIAGKKQPVMEKVTVFQTPDQDVPGPKIYRICWVVEGYPDFVFRTLRVNEIEEVDGEGGPQCVYRTSEDQLGPLAHVVKYVVGKHVEKGIQDWADDLKRVVESERAQQTPSAIERQPNE